MIEITKDQAKDLAGRYAFTCTDPDWDDLTDEARNRRLANGETEHGRVILHCMGGFMGADWDLAAVLADIDKATRVLFDPDSFMGHCLITDHGRYPDGRPKAWRFQVPADAFTPAS
jgi:hypothetical protein